MNRRQFLAMAGCTVASAGGIGGYYVVTNDNDVQESVRSETESVNQSSSIPTKVKQSKPIAGKFYEVMQNHYPDCKVYIRKNGEIVMEYNTQSESTDSLKTEMYNIADKFASVVKNNDLNPKTLTIVTSEVQAIVPQPSVKAYTEGTIEREGYLETIEVKGIERRTTAE